MERLKIALAGNPNVGKSTLFNQLTGMRQHVGNWPGKTVERAEGKFNYKANEINIIDLPGNYSLTAYSPEEVISRDYIIDEQPDVIINVIDAGNLERNLYLTVQMMELGANIVIALNMNKNAENQGYKINIKKLSELLGIPVVKIEANVNEGTDKLLDTVLKTATKPKNVQNRLKYGNELTEHINEISNEIKKESSLSDMDPYWTSIKLLENDTIITDVVKESTGTGLLNKVDKVKNHLKDVIGDNSEETIVDARYGYINGLITEAVKKPRLDKKTRTDAIDRIVTNKWLGLPIFAIIMYLIFQITFTIGAPLQDLIDEGFGALGEYLLGILGESWVSSLLVDGIIGGVGGVLTFVPIIFIMFFLLSLLEDSGYLARVAFVMDKIMHKLVGLHGKAFLPMLLGFGCCVPGVMATRTLEDEKDRLVTMLIVPFMSCNARLPVYVLFIAAFFSAYQGLVLFSLYFLGIAVAILTAFILKRTAFKGMSSPFIMELPPYRMPKLKGVCIHTWERGKGFLKKAGTIILATSIIIWTLSSLPVGVEYGTQDSVTGQIGTFLSPIFEPLGFGNWQTSVSLIFGVVAKENVVGTFGTLFGIDAEGDEDGMVSTLEDSFTPLSAYALLVFVLLYVPCFATVATIKKEANSWKWAGFNVVYSIAIAYIFAFIIYQGGMLLGLG